MNANIVVLNGETLINLSQDTAQDEDVRLGKTYHRNDGSLGVGTHQCSGGSGGITLIWGTWLFKSDLTLPSENIVQEINFTSNGWTHNKMEIASSSKGTIVYYYGEDSGEETEVYKPEASPKWLNDKYREVNYGKTPQSVSKEYFDYVTTNAEIVTVPEWDGSFTKTRDLTGTTWEFASGWHTEANQGVYEIEGELTVDSTVIISSLALGSPDGGASSMSNRISVLTDGTWYPISNGIAFTLKITGGKDAYHPDLVRWVESDGKLQ